MKKFALFVSIAITACGSQPDSYEISDSIQTLSSESGREITYRYLKPENCIDCPFVFFSHGAFSTYDRYDALLLPLAKKGFHIAAPNHTDSEEHKFRDEYTQAQSLPNRLEDYEIILNHYNPREYFAAGHSYGAMIAQISAGATLSGVASENSVDISLRPKAVIAISPPGPIPNYMERQGWQHVERPSLVVTGTTDIVPGMADNWEDHLV